MHSTAKFDPFSWNGVGFVTIMIDDVIQIGRLGRQTRTFARNLPKGMCNCAPIFTDVAQLLRVGAANIFYQPSYVIVKERVYCNCVFGESAGIKCVTVFDCREGQFCALYTLCTRVGFYSIR